MALPMAAAAVPMIGSTFAYTENRGANPYLPSGWRLVIGANVTPSGAGTTVVADQANDAWDYALPFLGYDAAPNYYGLSVAYTGQTGNWTIHAGDVSSASGAVTHVLDDVRMLPLTTGLVLGGDPLAPTITWNRHDSASYPGVCVPGSCNVGFDFFTYAVEVREASGNLVYQSAVINNYGPGTTFSASIPVSVLDAGENYLFGVRLQMAEMEQKFSESSWVVHFENRSVSYLAYSAPAAPVPEPSTALLALAGLGGMAAWSLRRRYRA